MKADPAAPAQSGIHRKTPWGCACMSISTRARTALIVVDMQNGFCVEKSRPLRWQIHGAT
jgi:hypothetical protein